MPGAGPVKGLKSDSRFALPVRRLKHMRCLFASPKINLPVARRRNPGDARLYLGGNAYRMSTLSRHRDSKDQSHSVPRLLRV